MRRVSVFALFAALVAMGPAGCEGPMAADAADDSAATTPGAATALGDRITLGGDRVRKVDGYDYVFYDDEPMLPAYRLPTNIPLKGDYYDDVRASKPERYAITEPPPAGAYRGMVEWEAMEAIVMSVPDYMDGYGNADMTILNIAKHAATVAEVWFIVPNNTTKTNIANHLASIGVPSSTIASKIKFVLEPLDSVWFIDSGPLPLVNNAGTSFAFADFRYYHNRVLDDGIPTWLGRKLGDLGMSSPTATYRMPLSTEGGTYQTTTDGVCFTGNRQLYNMSCDDGACNSSLRYMSLSQVQSHPLALEVKQVWGEYAGCEDVIITNSITDDGTGHIDMYMKIVDDNTILLGEYVAPYKNSAQQTNAARLDATAAFLDAYVKPNGGKFNVERIIMPGHRSSSSGQVPFTYINSTFINGLNLWPAFTFSDWVASRNLAQSQWEAVMPTWDHIWIDSEELSFWSGAIHCITRTIPATSPGPWVGDGACSGGMCNAPAGGYSGECYPGASSMQSCWGPEWLCSCNDCGNGCPYTGGGGQTGCGDITFEGCCDGPTLQYCDAGQIQGGHCTSGCGWNSSNGWYDCGYSGADPSGENPLSCDDLGGCTPTCGGAVCGDDGCGGSCGACGAGETCSAGQCEAVGGADCGDIEYVGCCDGSTLKYCENNELKSLACQTCGWNGGASFYDCQQTGADPSGQNPYSCDDLGACVPNCAGKECGADGCGGFCGDCGVHAECVTGQCVELCIPACAGKDCGQDGCGGSCGTCGEHEECNAVGECISTICEPDCHLKQCGDDGCGGVCGVCLANAACVDSQCVPLCMPSCNGKECGGDGCGGTCGTCAAGEVCTANQCVGTGGGDSVQQTYADYDHMLLASVVQTIPIAGYTVGRARVTRAFKGCLKPSSYVLFIHDPDDNCGPLPAIGSYWVLGADNTQYGASWLSVDMCGYTKDVYQVTSPEAQFLLGAEASKVCP